MAIYCPTCNRSSDEIRFIGNFCEFCIIKKLEKQIPASSITILKCKFCNRIKEGETFSEISKPALARAIEIGFKLNSMWKVKVKDFDDKTMHTVFIADYQNEKVGIPKDIEYKFGKQTCQRCDKISGGYYEAILQLRGDFDRINNLIAKVTKYVEKRNGFIAKIEKVEGGKDVYLSDKLMTNDFVHDYELKPKRSFRLYGMKNGRKLYRNTYSLHF